MKTAKKWIALLLVLTMTMGLFAGLTVTAAAEDAAAVPTLKEGVAAVKTDTVKTGMAYLLSDLQAGRIFQAPEGTTISVAGKNYWWERPRGIRRGPVRHDHDPGHRSHGGRL